MKHHFNRGHIPEENGPPIRAVFSCQDSQLGVGSISAPPICAGTVTSLVLGHMQVTTAAEVPSAMTTVSKGQTSIAVLPNLRFLQSEPSSIMFPEPCGRWQDRNNSSRDEHATVTHPPHRLAVSLCINCYPQK